MHPGSGPSNRHNDVYFPQIREHLLAAGIAVASFDKRGVGGSSGHWTDAGIVEQAVDATAALEHLARVGSARPVRPVRAQPGRVGRARGHGGWGTGGTLVITNSGPGVSPAVQDRYALHQQLRREGRTPAQIATRLDAFDAMAGMLRHGVGFDSAQVQLVALGADDGAGFVAADGREWGLARAILDHDPRPAMRRIDVPVLALFGADDEIVPVEESVEVFRAEVRPERLTVAVLPGGDHRVQTGDPPRLVDGYAATLIGFILDAAS